jgi:hypothetical protein
MRNRARVAAGPERRGNANRQRKHSLPPSLEGPGNRGAEGWHCTGSDWALAGQGGGGLKLFFAVRAHRAVCGKSGYRAVGHWVTSRALEAGARVATLRLCAAVRAASG